MSKLTRARHQEVSKVSEGKVAEVLMIHKNAHSTISKEMRTSVMKVTPEIAQAWLGTRGKQRSINRHTVDSFARDMKQGAWETTHQGIAFNLMGQLIDGQHRLMAVVQSETPVMMVVTLGCPAEYDSPIDRGRARSIGDIINKSGTLVAICNALIIIENGTQGRTTPSEVLEMYNKHLPGVTFAGACWVIPTRSSDVLARAIRSRSPPSSSALRFAEAISSRRMSTSCRSSGVSFAI